MWLSNGATSGRELVFANQMSEFICKNCNALLGVGNVYCLNCGTPVVASAADDGPETVVRTREPLANALNTISTRAIVAGIAVALLIVGGVVGGLYMLAKYDDERTKRIRDLEDRERQNRYQTEAAANTAKVQSPIATPMPGTTKPTATPRIPTSDEIKDRLESEGRRPANSMANAMANVANVAANAMRRAANNPIQNLMYDRSGRMLRAICKNGQPSYWQYDKWATCGANGGVLQWNMAHPKN